MYTELRSSRQADTGFSRQRHEFESLGGRQNKTLISQGSLEDSAYLFLFEVEARAPNIVEPYCGVLSIRLWALG